MAATSKLLFSFFIEDQMPLEKWQNLHVDAAALTPVYLPIRRCIPRLPLPTSLVLPT